MILGFTPMRKSRELKITVGEEAFNVVEWPGSGDPVLMLHATGFHSRCWTQVVERLPDQQVYAVDLRFHGGSTAAGDVSWPSMTADIQQLINALGLTRIVGVGHSIGGHLIARAAAALPEQFKQLVLIDPVIMPPEIYAQFNALATSINPADHPVSRRKNQWQDAEEMYTRFLDRPPFNTWMPEVLRDYCDYALHPHSDEEYLQLACDPINEASIYLSQAGNDVVLQDLSRIQTPATLLRAAPGEAGVMDLSNSPTWPELANHLPCCREHYLPEMNHFIPMQDPQLVADIICEAQQDSWQH